MNENQILQKKIRVLKEMESLLKIMDYIKVIDVAINKSTDIKFKNYWNVKFHSNVHLLKLQCIPFRKILEDWFQIEKDNNLERDLNLHASYKAMEGF